FIAAAGATSAGVDECGTDLIFGEGDDAFNADRFLRIVPEVLFATLAQQTIAWSTVEWMTEAAEQLPKAVEALQRWDKEGESSSLSLAVRALASSLARSGHSSAGQKLARAILQAFASLLHNSYSPVDSAEYSSTTMALAFTDGPPQQRTAGYYDSPTQTPEVVARQIGEVWRRKVLKALEEQCRREAGMGLVQLLVEKCRANQSPLRYDTNALKLLVELSRATDIAAAEDMLAVLDEDGGAQQHLLYEALALATANRCSVLKSDGDGILSIGLVFTIVSSTLVTRGRGSPSSLTRKDRVEEFLDRAVAAARSAKDCQQTLSLPALFMFLAYLLSVVVSLTTASDLPRSEIKAMLLSSGIVEAFVYELCYIGSSLVPRSSNPHVAKWLSWSGK
ncbi:hypothetical protein Pmar_PMAR026858, partial [Perkinsus marinus ATCC 50983]